MASRCVRTEPCTIGNIPLYYYCSIQPLAVLASIDPLMMRRREYGALLGGVRFLLLYNFTRRNIRRILPDDFLHFMGSSVSRAETNSHLLVVSVTTYFSNDR